MKMNGLQIFTKKEFGSVRVVTRRRAVVRGERRGEGAGV